MTAYWNAPRPTAIAPTMAIPFDSGASGSAGSMSVAQLGAWVAGFTVNGSEYVTPDGRVLTDVSVTNGAATVTSISYAFTSADIGKVIAVRAAGNAGGTIALCGYIGSVSSGVASLVATVGGSALNAARSASSLTATFGTNNKTALNNALSAASTIAQITGNSVVVDLPSGIICIDDTVTVLSRVSVRGRGMYATVIKYITATATTAAFLGTTGSAASPYVDCRFTDFALDMFDATESTYQVSHKGIFIQYMYRAVFQRLYIIGTPASSLGVDFLVDTLIEGNVIQFAGRLNGGANPGGAAVGIGTGSTTLTCDGIARVESVIVANNHIYGALRYGVFYENQGAARGTGKYVTVNNVIQMTSVSLVGLGDCGATNALWLGNLVTGAGTGVGLEIAKGTVSTSLPGVGGISKGNRFDNLASGYNLDYSGSTVVAAVAADYVFDDVITGCTDHGVKIKTSATVGYVVSGLDFGRTRVSGGAKCGFNVTGTAPIKRLNLGAVTVKNNGTGGVAPRSGVYFAAPADYVWLDAARIYDDQGSPTQSYGLEVNTGVTVSNVLLPSYSFDGHVTGSIGGSGTLTGTRLSSVAYP